MVDDWKLDHQDVEKVTYFDSNGISTIKKIAKSAIYALSYLDLQLEGVKV